MGCNDGLVYSIIICIFNFWGVYVFLVKNLFVKGREREKNRENERRRVYRYIRFFFLV